MYRMILVTRLNEFPTGPARLLRIRFNRRFHSIVLLQQDYVFSRTSRPLRAGLCGLVRKLFSAHRFARAMVGDPSPNGLAQHGPSSEPRTSLTLSCKLPPSVPILICFATSPVTT